MHTRSRIRKPTEAAKAATEKNAAKRRKVATPAELAPTPAPETAPLAAVAPTPAVVLHSTAPPTFATPIVVNHDDTALYVASLRPVSAIRKGGFRKGQITVRDGRCWTSEEEMALACIRFSEENIRFTHGAGGDITTGMIRGNWQSIIIDEWDNMIRRYKVGQRTITIPVSLPECGRWLMPCAFLLFAFQNLKLLPAARQAAWEPFGLFDTKSGFANRFNQTIPAVLS